MGIFISLFFYIGQSGFNRLYFRSYIVLSSYISSRLCYLNYGFVAWYTDEPLPKQITYFLHINKGDNFTNNLIICKNVVSFKCDKNITIIAAAAILTTNLHSVTRYIIYHTTHNEKKCFLEKSYTYRNGSSDWIVLISLFNGHLSALAFQFHFEYELWRVNL
jgi:hypothetical protein